MPDQDPTPRPDAAPHWLVRRGSLLAYLIVVLVVLAAVNVLASRHDKSWDLTKNRQYSLGAESVKILQGLHQPLQLIYFDRAANFGAAKEFFGRYQRESNRVQVQYVDPDRRPDLARQYKVQNYGSIVVRSGDHQEIVTNMAEQDVTNAMVRVLKGARKVIYFTEGEGERDPADTGRGGYSTLKTALEAENFTVQTLVLAQTPAVPADCAVLVVAGTTHPMVAPEVQAIQNYINGGGHVLFLVAFQQAGPLVDYLQSSLNVKLAPGLVVDTSGIGRLFGATAVMPIAAHYDTHPITAQMDSTATLFPYARPVDPGAVPGSKAVVSPLVETSAQSFVAPAADLASGTITETPSDRHGPLTLGVAGTLATTANAGSNAGDSAEARYVVFASPDFPSNAIISFDGNRDLFLNSVDWLSTQQDFITIRPQTPTNTPINMSAAQMRLVLLSFLFGLPLAVVIIGVGVWWRRRAL